VSGALIPIARVSPLALRPAQVRLLLVLVRVMMCRLVAAMVAVCRRVLMRCSCLAVVLGWVVGPVGASLNGGRLHGRRDVAVRLLLVVRHMSVCMVLCLVMLVTVCGYSCLLVLHCTCQ
jgi:hypothetical protein